MRASFKALLGLFAAVALASCGGGGGGDSNSGFNPAGTRVEVTASATSTTQFSLVPVTVRVTGENGTPVPDGTQVSLTVSPTGVGLVSSAITAPPNGGGTVQLGETATSTLAGGVANFRFHPRSAGTATLTASTNVTARTASGSTQVTVAAGAPNDPRLQIQVQSRRIPIRPRSLGFNDTVFFGSPYISEVVVTWRNLDGSCVVSRTEADAISIAVGPGLTPSGLWHDDPETDENEFVDANGNVQIFQSITMTPQGCRALFYVISDGTSGNVTLNATAVDQLTGEVIQATTQIEIFSGAAALPGSVLIDSDSGPVYIQGVNGPQSKPVSVFVVDGAGTNVPDPGAGVNNVVLEIVGPAGGERLRGTNAAGAVVSGASISLRSVNGVAAAIYESGTRAGVVTLRATSDRADNNVDNGIQDPVVSTRTFTVSDGRLFDIEITFPTIGAIFVNPGLAPGDEGITITLPDGGEIVVPSNPDGTFSLTVSAIATDRFGNPVPAGTEIRFGLIDHPLTNNFFAIAGNDGDPQEGGTLFTAPTGQFTTAGGGAGPGDTLLVFGEDSPGNRDLEAARTVQSINSPTSLTVQRRFNQNDDTGTTVNNGPVLPYVIGRATSATIQPSGTTNSLGIATVIMTYPVSQLGRLSAVWAQGSGDLVAGLAELVTDIEFVPLPGLAPGSLTADPSQIPGNSTQSVTVCVRDALGNGLRGVTVSFAFEGLTGTGSVDGNGSSGVLDTPTGVNGCTVASVQTSGVVPSGTGQGATTPRVRFSAAGLTDTVDILAGALILQAIPSAFSGDGAGTVTLRLLDGSGNPVSGVQLTGSCEADAPGSLSLIQPPGVTNAQGETTARIQAEGFNTIDEEPPTGECTFTTATGTPTAIVTWTGFDLCTVGVSPVPPGCGTSTNATLNLTLNGGTTGGTVQGNGTAINCTALAGQTVNCSAQFPQNTLVALQSSPNRANWTGDCAPTGGNPSTNATVTMSANRTCVATMTTTPP